jgi:lipid-A-disaccharide synthase
MVAGEPSGDLLAGLLLDGLKARWPDLQAVGIGGPQMQQRGFQAWWAQSLLAVRGYAEVLPHLFKLLSIRRDLGARLIADPPDVFIGIDAPDFNFGLEARLKAAGIRTVHFVSPSFWAWRAGKLAKLKASADHVLCIFPFEPPLLAQHGIAATYVGHPLANVIPLEPDPPGGPRGAGPAAGRSGGSLAAGQPRIRNPLSRCAISGGCGPGPGATAGRPLRTAGHAGASRRGRAGGTSQWPGATGC